MKKNKTFTIKTILSFAAATLFLACSNLEGGSVSNAVGGPNAAGGQDGAQAPVMVTVNGSLAFGGAYPEQIAALVENSGAKGAGTIQLYITGSWLYCRLASEGSLADYEDGITTEIAKWNDSYVPIADIVGGAWHHEKRLRHAQDWRWVGWKQRKRASRPLHRRIPHHAARVGASGVLDDGHRVGCGGARGACSLFDARMDWF